MRGSIRFVRGAAVAGIVLVALGAGLLTLGPDRLAELAAEPPPWLAVSAIVFATFAMATLVAYLAREKPATVVSEPHEFPRRPRPVDAAEPAVLTRPADARSLRVPDAAPAQLRLADARAQVIVPPPPPPIGLGLDPPVVPPAAQGQNLAPLLVWDGGPAASARRPRWWHAHGRRTHAHRIVLRRVARGLGQLGNLARGVPILVWRAAVTVARALRAEARLARGDLAHAQRCVKRTLRAAGRQVLHDARATGQTASQVSRVACQAIGRGGRIAGTAVARAARTAQRAVACGARTAAWVARVAGGTLAGLSITVGRAAAHQARAAARAVGHAATVPEHALVHRTPALSRAGAGGPAAGPAGAQTTRSVTAAGRGAEGKAGSTLMVPSDAAAADRGERRWRKPSSGPPRWHDVARQVHDEHGGDRLLLLQVALRIEAKHREFAQMVRAAARPERYVVGALYAVPPLVVVVTAVLVPGHLSRLASNATSLQVAVAALLTAAGVWWLQRLVRAPFSLRPSVRRPLRREAALSQRLEAVLERAALYAAAGLEAKDALQEATRSDPVGPGTLVTQALAGAHSDEGRADVDTTVLRCARALTRRLDEGAPAVDALVLSADQLRRDSQAERAPRAALAVPLIVCFVPAALLLALV